jgi:AmmeMemoRadiSam system protein A
MPELGALQRRQLLAVARRAIQARLSGAELPPEEADAALRERRGAFVTLRRRETRELRGCVGYVEPRYPLVESVARAAAAAATHDDRFAPVGRDELERLSLDISALGLLAPISPGDVVVGTHGLVIRHHGRTGLLLPQVAVEHGWDAPSFLAHTCLKAGLPADAWRLPGAELLGFTAEVFGEE